MKESKFSSVFMKGSQIAGSYGLSGNGEPLMWIIQHHFCACDCFLHCLHAGLHFLSPVHKNQCSIVSAIILLIFACHQPWPSRF